MCRKTKASPTQLSRETLVRTALPRSLLNHRLVSMRVGRNSSNVLHANQLQIKERVSLESENRESPVRGLSLQDSMRTQYAHFLLHAVESLQLRVNCRGTLCPRASWPSSPCAPALQQRLVQRRECVIDKESSEESYSSHINELDDGPLPTVGLTTHHG